VARGAAFLFVAYIGFDAVSTTAQEAKKPQRDVPIGILGAISISTVLYVLFACVLVRLVNYHGLDAADPLTVGIDKAGLQWAASS
jgi:APA family basic amino acid/polyamine antiporter